MSSISDFQLYAAGFNFLSMLGNVWWSFKLNGIKGAGELSQYWKAEFERKDRELKDLKVQYHHMLATNKKLEGEVSTYRRFHEHDIDIKQKSVVE